VPIVSNASSRVEVDEAIEVSWIYFVRKYWYYRGKNQRTTMGGGK
jgi:hypothetical protein